MRLEDQSSLGMAAYSLDSHAYERLAPVGSTGYLLDDNRRVLFSHQGKLFLMDSQSKNMHEVLSVAPYEVVQQFGFSRAGRLITFTRDATEADIWLMNTK